MKSAIVPLFVGALLIACGARAPNSGDRPAATTPPAGPRVISVESTRDFSETVEALKAAIAARGFTTFAVIDHASGAASVGLKLAPATLIVFGNPKGGTPLMQADLGLGVVLPLRILVHAADGKTTLVYPAYDKVIGDYDSTLGERSAKIMSALAALSKTAAVDETIP